MLAVLQQDESSLEREEEAVEEVCQLVHSILVEEPSLIFQLHQQTYPITCIPVLVTHVESLHVVLNNFIVD